MSDDEDNLCYSFGESSRGGTHGEEGGGRARRPIGWRGRPRGPRRGRGRGEAGDESFPLGRYSSTDSVNRERGGREHRGFRDRGGNRGNFANDRNRGRDHSYDPSVVHRDPTGRVEQRGRGDNRGFRGRDGRRGRQNYSGAGRGGRPRHFPIRYIAEIEDLDEIILRLNSQIDDFDGFMSEDVMTTDDTMKTLMVLSRVLKNHLQREIVLKILQVVCTSRFLDTHLALLIQKLSSYILVGSVSTVVEVIESIQLVLTQVCLKLPSHASKGLLLLSVLNNTPEVVQLLQQHNPGLLEGLKELLGQCQECMNSLQARVEKGDSRTTGRERRGPNEDDDTPPDDFASLPIFPSPQDMDWNERVFLRANKETGSYRDVNHYLDVQFRLLREDYIRPLRMGINHFKHLKDRGEVFKKSQDIRQYYKVQIVSMVCRENLEHRLQMEMTPELKRIRWQSSKRFLFGSLVCLSMDDFDTIFFAVVTNRDTKDLEKGIIQVSFESGLDDILDLSSKDVFTLAETTAYFEAYRHVLEGLSEMKDALPMARYIVDCNRVIKPPKYLLTDASKGIMDLSSLLKDPKKHDASAVMVLNPQRWPPVEQTTLNKSQMEATQTALSKELAIVQGPPGTGKTYVGLKVAKILLDNRQVWTDPKQGQRPILVVCYTNHALDQFLEGILSFCPKGIVRVGSRCKTPQLEPFNLKNIRMKVRLEKKVSKSTHYSIKDCSRHMKTLKYKIDSVSLKLEATTKGVVSAKALQGHMLPGQYESLTRTGLFGARAGGGQGTVMMQWLSKGAVTQEMGEEADPYPMLAAEVTSKILQGEGMYQEASIDPDSVRCLPPTVRAQLYRLWLHKAMVLLQQDAAASVHPGSNPQQSRRWQEMVQGHILPDSILRRVISGPVFSAITQPLSEQHARHKRFCVRAWLGVGEREPGQVLQRIIHKEDACDATQLPAQEMMRLPRQMRLQLYRFWRKKLIQIWNGRKKSNKNKAKQILQMADQEILPDDILELVMRPEHFVAIRTEMMTRHQRQAEYFIRAWLGVHDFCQNPAHLETLLDQLEGESDGGKESEMELNIEEEAESIQNSRQLDLDDDDDLFNFDRKTTSLDMQSTMQELGVESSFSVSAADDEGFSVPLYHQKKQLKKIKALLSSSTAMTEAEARKVVNLWTEQLSVENRVRLYLFWRHNYEDSLRQSVKEQANEYKVKSRELRELKMGEDKNILEEATIIGMTTTGAARYRRVLTGVACPIVILEEAAEVLEAHAVTTLHETCQHLILIGDHQQLRPSPTVYELSLNYKLDLSLFERLVSNDLHHSTLAVQHRMRPEVAHLMRHVYPALKDHETTLKRPHIRGLKQDVFLFHHEVRETVSSETSSKSNEHEAELCVRLCRYLLQQDYPTDSITILTAYSGQVFALKNIMMKDQDFYRGVRVTTVDNYQGEESDVIILSLVRSNEKGTVGFLGTDNRVCVALSRARNGLFAFGNFVILSESSELWKKICRTAKDHGQLGNSLVLRCENHLDQETHVTTAKDFDKMPEGGCKQPCGTRLDCGHVCELSCHGYDRDHEKYRCRKKCERTTCKLGHPCKKKCYQDCGKCVHMVTKTVPMCGHMAEMECSRDPHTWQCTERCKGTLPCNHQCSGECGNCWKEKSHVLKCPEVEERVWPCGHLVQSPCHVTPGQLPCTKPCGAVLQCSHTCAGTCGKCWAGRVHVACKEKCGRSLPGCSHKCPLPCGSTCLPCAKTPCWTTCTHSSCKEQCGTPCRACKEECPWKGCEHQKCRSLCHDPCSPCGQPCPTLQLPCGTDKEPHPCSGLCGEKCFCLRCEKEENFRPLAIQGVETEEQSVEVGKETQLIKLPQCGHIFKVVVMDMYVKKKAESLPVGASVYCPVDGCKKKIQDRDCWRYHRLFQQRHKRFQKLKGYLQWKTTVPKSCHRDLKYSLSTLTHNAEEHKSFASMARQDYIFNHAFNVNVVHALACQIKMTKVFDASCAALRDLRTLYGGQKDIPDRDVLQQLLYRPANHMTPQRRQELSTATKRVALMTKLLCAEHFSTSPDLKEQIECGFKLLKEKRGTESFEEAEAVLKDCHTHCRPTWTRLIKAIDIDLLDEPPEKGICEPLQKSGPKGNVEGAKKLSAAGSLQAASDSWHDLADEGKPAKAPKPPRPFKPDRLHTVKTDTLTDRKVFGMTFTNSAATASTKSSAMTTESSAVTTESSAMTTESSAMTPELPEDLGRRASQSSEEGSSPRPLSVRSMVRDMRERLRQLTLSSRTENDGQ